MNIALGVQLTEALNPPSDFAEARHVQEEAEDTLRSSIRTELTLIQSYCRLARQEIERAHHLEMAEAAFEAILRMTKHVELNQEQREEIEEVQRNVHELGGRDLSQQAS